VRSGRIFAVFALALAMTAPLFLTGRAAAGSVGLSGPAGPAAVAGSAAPEGVFAATLQFAVSSVSPSVVNAAGGNTLTIRATVTNTAAVPVTGLIFRLQRGPALADSAAVRRQIDNPTTPTAVIAGPFARLTDRLEPGANTGLAVATTISGLNPGSLRISKPGIYPLMVNVNGAITDNGSQHEARLGALHLLVTVTSVPGAPPTPSAAKVAVPFGLIWPLSSRPHRGVNGVFLDDSLATDISPGHVLANRVDALAAARLPNGSAILAVDPLLLEELDAMSRGYRVLRPNTVQGPITSVPVPTTHPATSETGSSATAPSGPPTDPSSAKGAPSAGSSADEGAGSTGSPAPGSDTVATDSAATETAGTAAAAPPPNTVAGTGAQAAAAFLARLRNLAAGTQVLVLPYSNPDTVAVGRSRANFTALARDGRAVAARVLAGAALLTDVALPPDAVTDPATLDDYLAAGYHSVLLSASGLSGNDGTGKGLVATAKGTKLPALIDDSSLRSLLGEVIHPSAGTGAMALNTTVALVARRSFDGDRRAIVRMPDTVVTAAGLDDLGAAISALTADGAVGPARLPALATAAKADPRTRSVTAALPATEEAVLLDADYLRRLEDTRAELRRLAAALPAAVDPGAELLIGQLTSALTPLTSTSLRTDRSPGDAVLSTVDATIAHLRSGVTIRPTVGSYTLASSDSPLVLTVQNTLPFAVKVKVRIDGGAQSGLTTEPPEWVTVAAGSTRQLQIPATVSRAGTFQVSAQLIGPDGQAWNDPVELRIRSNAYGTLTIVLISVAGGVLLLMVALRIWQRWKARRDRIAAEAARAHQPPPPPAAGSIIASVSDPEEGDSS
jgi:hypothetical protein